MTPHSQKTVRKGPPWATVLVCVFCYVESFTWTVAAPLDLPEVFNITRVEGGDTFSFKGSECVRKECSGRTENLTCTCACPSKTPLFREDIQQCVGEISECAVAPFGSGSSAQKIPYVFLPHKGQIIYPSKAVTFPGVRTPICAVSGAQFLTRNGFIDLRSSVDSDVPFTLFRDEGRTFIQWAGDQEMRQRMEGRLLVVQLLCRDVAALTGSGHSTRVSLGALPTSLFGVFTPCAAFRVAGSPTRHITNVTEVLFAPNARFSEDSSTTGLTLSEYIAIGISSVLLGLIYVASVFLYLHIKKRKAKNERDLNDQDLKSKIKRDVPVRKRDIEHVERDRRAALMTHPQNNHVEDVIVKNNPLLNIERHFHDTNILKDDFLTESDECQTDENELIDEGNSSEEMLRSSHQTTSVTVHPVVHSDQGRMIYESYYKAESFPPRDENTIERLPEENVSIVETFDFRDDRPESLPVGTARRKLYFNPAYFEPHLLMAPPPAAIEFLMKIREVISIAKHKMASKRFTPSLGGIPEEDTHQNAEPSSNFYHIGSQRSSVVSLKRENNRRKVYCSGCPGCEKRFLQDMSPLSSDINSGMVCHNCSTSNSFNKQSSIRKWLEGVPGSESSNPNHEYQKRDISPLTQYKVSQDTSSLNALGMLNSLLSLPKDNKRQARYYNGFTTRSLYAEDDANNFIIKKKTSSSSVRSEPPIRNFNIPLPNIHNSPMTYSHRHFDNNISTVTKIKDISTIGIKIPYAQQNSRSPRSNKALKDHRLPDMINEALVIDKNKIVIPKSINSVSKHLTGQRKKIEPINEKSANSTLEKTSSADYETDSLERGNVAKGFSTPTEYADVSSSQTSPTLSTALPMDEELTMRNAVYKVGSESRPTSRVSNKSQSRAQKNDYDHVESEIMQAKTVNAFENHIYNFSSPSVARADYNLVSEVYVNNGYNFGSAPTSPSESDTSTFGRRKINSELLQPIEKLGQLTIEVKDAPENYIKVHESDGFEPDTLDRKPSKLKTHIDSNCPELTELTNKMVDINNKIPKGFLLNGIESGIMNDGLKNNDENYTVMPTTKIEFNDSQDYEIIENSEIVTDSEEGRILTLESRHCKRQRESTPPSIKGSSKFNPPDIIPFEDANIYEYPKPPRLVKLPPPPLPPKNEDGRSPNLSKNSIKNVIAVPGRKARAPTPPSELSPGQRCPSGASVRSMHSSDYEKVTPVDDPFHKVNERAKIILPIIDNTIKMLNVEHDIVEQVTCGKVTCVTSKPGPKFREFQTPKAGRKLKNPLTPRKSPRDRPGSMRKTFRPNKKQNYKEDSGYLSTDSNESKQVVKKTALVKETKFSGSETDESLEDARSESGAESVETHSVFFGSFRKLAYAANSADSGRSSDERPSSLIST